MNSTVPSPGGSPRSQERKHEREQKLPLSVVSHVVQLHRQTADRAREAYWHVLDPASGPVLKAGRDQGRFVDAGAAVLPWEGMRALFELPVQNVIEAIHGGHP